MTKKEQQIRQDFKKTVISLIHELPIKEAMREELVKGCRVLIEVNYHHHVYEEYELLDTYGRNFSDRCTYVNCNEDTLYQKIITITEFDEIHKITGLPITLSRVLQALGSQYFFQNGFIGVIKNGITDIYGYHTPLIDKVCEWKLTNKDGSTCTDDDQAIEEIEKLLNLLKN